MAIREFTNKTIRSTTASGYEVVLQTSLNEQYRPINPTTAVISRQVDPGTTRNPVECHVHSIFAVKEVRDALNDVLRRYEELVANDNADA
jgi:hypothetical protein